MYQPSRRTIVAVLATTAVLTLASCGSSAPNAAVATTRTPTVDPHDPHVIDFNDGFIDGRSDAVGDNDRDGRIEPGEAGWACRNTTLLDLDLCLTIANRPTGPAALAGVTAAPGTPAYRVALGALAKSTPPLAP